MSVIKYRKKVGDAPLFLKALHLFINTVNFNSTWMQQK